MAALLSGILPPIVLLKNNASIGGLRTPTAVHQYQMLKNLRVAAGYTKSFTRRSLAAQDSLFSSALVLNCNACSRISVDSHRLCTYALGGYTPVLYRSIQTGAARRLSVDTNRGSRLQQLLSALSGS